LEYINTVLAMPFEMGFVPVIKEEYEEVIGFPLISDIRQG